MPAPDRTAEEFPSEEQFLAAVERAERHKRSEEPGVVFPSVVDHLGLPRGSWTTRRLRPKLDALEVAGLIRRFRLHGSTVWTLTPNGRHWLATARRSGTVGELPESPQHKTWRKARDTATERIIEFQAEIQQALAGGDRLLENGTAISSKQWFEMGQRLGYLSWRLGSAIYCLQEWAEPDDATFDLDQPPTRAERGRRDTHLWDQG